MPKTSTPEPIRKITDQVELIDWLIDLVKSDKPEMIRAGEVTCFDTVALEYKYGRLDLGDMWGEYLVHLFDDLVDQEEKVLCSPAVRWLAARALGAAAEHSVGEAQHFIDLLLVAARLQRRILATPLGNTTRLKSTWRFEEQHGFRCDVTVKHGEYADLYRREVGEQLR
ncbi:hypothetical protein ACVDG8_014715 [Mesorhizobium sp. ORM8.1]